MIKCCGVAALIAACVTTACGGSSSTSGTTPTAPTATTTFQGTVAGLTASQTGTLDVTVQATVARREFFALPFVVTLNAQSTNATGSLHLTGGSTTSLTGTWNSTGNSLSLSGGGFALTGTATTGVLSGRYTGPNSTSGGFSTLNTTAGAITRYCGTYLTVMPSIGYTETGNFNIQTSADGHVSGLFATTSPTTECCGLVRGSVSGTTITLITNDPNGDITSTGTVQGGTVSGSNPIRGGTSGTTSFSGTSSACQ